MNFTRLEPTQSRQHVEIGAVKAIQMKMRHQNKWFIFLS